jgi:hypothetical protein
MANGAGSTLLIVDLRAALYDWDSRRSRRVESVRGAIQCKSCPQDSSSMTTEPFNRRGTRTNKRSRAKQQDSNKQKLNQINIKQYRDTIPHM